MKRIDDNVIDDNFTNDNFANDDSASFRAHEQTPQGLPVRNRGQAR